MTYTQRTLEALRDRGATVAVVERFNRFAGTHGRRHDLFGFIDIVAMIPGRPLLGVQSTGPSGHADHKRKIVMECSDAALRWLECGGEIELWSWRKLLVKKGGKLRTWQPRVESITKDMFYEVADFPDSAAEFGSFRAVHP